MPVTRPAAPCPAADQRQWQRPALLPAGHGPESQLCAGIQLHAQSLLLWPLSWLSGQPRNTFLSGGVGVQQKIFIHLVDLLSHSSELKLINSFLSQFSPALRPFLQTIVISMVSYGEVYGKQQSGLGASFYVYSKTSG